ncbi:MAG: hypothetical protein QGH41_10030, partial [Roseibacillus sp.]|nr:hypothetical protein [Roseibacillus sp.]
FTDIPLWIGRSSGLGKPYFKGLISRVRIYNRALSEQEVSNLYDIEKPDSYVLDVAAANNGSVTGAGTFAAGTTATLTATPDLGYLFTGWTDDAAGTDNPLALVMDGNQTVGATFAQDARDPDQDGLSNYQELVLHGTDPDNADSDGDGFSDLEEIAAGSDPTDPTDPPDPGARLVKVTFNADLTAATLFLEGLTPGELYHVIGTVDGEEFFHFHDSEFTADAPDLEVVQLVDVAFRRRLLLKVMAGPVMEGPIPPQDP